MSSWKKVDRTDDVLTVSFRKKLSKTSAEKQKTEEGLKNWTMKDIAIMTMNERAKRRESAEKNGQVSPETKKLLKELTLDGEMPKVTKKKIAGRVDNSFGTSGRRKRFEMKDKASDKELSKSLDKVLDRNRYFRFYYGLPLEPNESRDNTAKSNKSSKSSRSSKSSKTSRTSGKSSFSNNSMDFSNAKRMMAEVGKVKEDDDLTKSSSSKSTKKLKAKKSRTLVDHNGIPLSHPLATTPFPGALSKEHREKARELLKMLAKRKSHLNGASSQEKKQKNMEEFPNRVDAETREKARRALTEMANSRSNNNSTSCSAETVSNVKQEITTSGETCSESNSELETKRNACTHCGTCIDCGVKCTNKHGIVTDEDKKKFAREIMVLRESIQKPLKTRRRHSRQPYDLTQSSSDSAVNTQKGSTKKSGHR